MGKLIAATLAFGCACSADAAVATGEPPIQADPVQPTTSTTLLSPEPALLDWTRRGAYRWNTATGCAEGSGCEFVVGEGGIPIEYADSIPRQGQGDAGGVLMPDPDGPGWLYVHIRRGTADPFRMLMHELGHLRGAEHTPTGVTASLGRTISQEEALELDWYTISSAALDAACARVTCLEFVPEE